MKRNYILAIVLLTISINLMAQDKTITENPLLQKWNTPFNTAPFDKIKVEHYVPAFDYALTQARAEIKAIAQSKEKPTFKNTIEAMEYSGALLTNISGVFYNMLECESTDELQNAAMVIMPKMTEYGNDISLDPILFKRVKDIYQNKDKENLNKLQLRLLEKTYKGFVRNGANLDEKGKARYREITAELSDLGLKFNQNLLKENSAFTLNITNKADLSGLPESALEMGAMAAKQKGLEGWLFDLSMPSYLAFMKYSDNRDLRKKMYIAYNSRCYKGDEFDNSKIILRITELRLEMAKLLGYNTYAEYVLEERMAKNSKTVMDFLNKLFEASIEFAKADYKELSDFASKNGLSDKLQKWDWAYYSEKLKSQKFNIDDEQLKPYFKLENVKNGIFKLSEMLYGLKFKKNTKIPVYNPDVEVYEVMDEKGALLAILYLDFFPRESKSNGAWMTSFKDQYIKDGIDYRPQIQVVCNFTKPTADKPSLLTFDEVSTFLHEFGHALHGMLSQNIYPSLTGTSVYRDFVELPSQFMENYATEQQFLNLFAFHYVKGDTLPVAMINKIRDFNNFQAGYVMIRQLMFGMLDMSWHSISEPVTISVSDFERNSISKLEFLPPVDGINASVAYGHIFSGGYAAGYYGYKWAEVLDADAFSLFQKNGIFDKKTAASFRNNILSKGNSEHPMDLYLRFRGQEPDLNALLKRSGLIKK